MAYLVLVLGFVLAPVATLVLFSFQEGSIPALPIESFSLRWYRAAWRNRDFREGLANSLQVGVVVALLSTAIGFWAAHVLSRRLTRGRGLYMAVLCLPALVPPILSGFALLMYYQRIRLYGTAWAIIAAHTCYCSPFAVALLRNEYDRLDIDLELAAKNLGAGPFDTILEVVIPQMWPALAAAAALCFLVSWDEFVIAWFVGGFVKTFPTVVYGMLGTSLNPSINAVGTVVTAVSALLLGVVLWLLGPWMREGP
jgi:spermidine/putrescine transport system permease protein